MLTVRLTVKKPLISTHTQIPICITNTDTAIPEERGRGDDAPRGLRDFSKVKATKSKADQKLGSPQLLRLHIFQLQASLFMVNGHLG